VVSAMLKTTVVSVCLTVVTAVGCSQSHTVAGHASGPSSPSAPSKPPTVQQSALLPNYVAEQDPKRVLQEGLYSLLRQPMGGSVLITGYRNTAAPDGTKATTATFAFNPMVGGWESLPDRQLVWSPSQKQWVESDLTETLSPGPMGSRGWPTLKAVADFGTRYYTYSFKELGGLPIESGLEQGFSQGGPLPQEITAGKFGPGARAYIQTETSVDPFYNIQRVEDANTKTPTLQIVYACGTPSPQCQTPATNLEAADQHGGQFTNFAHTALLELDGKGHATLRPVDTDIPFATYTYRINNDAPRRITFQSANDGDATKFTQALGVPLKHFALFEYDNHVTIGWATPPNTTADSAAGYNQVAVNDILPRWTPPSPAVP
jgi:hypothetical protein